MRRYVISAFQSCTKRADGNNSASQSDPDNWEIGFQHKPPDGFQWNSASCWPQSLSRAHPKSEEIVSKLTLFHFWQLDMTTKTLGAVRSLLPLPFLDCIESAKVLKKNTISPQPGSVPYARRRRGIRPAYAWKFDDFPHWACDQWSPRWKRVFHCSIEEADSQKEPQARLSML